MIQALTDAIDALNDLRRAIERVERIKFRDIGVEEPYNLHPYAVGLDGEALAAIQSITRESR